MDVLILSYDADPDHGGFGARVHALVRMFAEFAKVRVVLTDWFGGIRIPGVVYEQRLLRDTAWTRVARLRTYYKTDYPRSFDLSADLVVVETLDLWGLTRRIPGTPRILDEHNVYWDLLAYDMSRAPFFSTRVGRNAAVRRLLEPYLWRRAKAYELRALRDASATLVTSEPDRARILQQLPDLGPRLRVVPNAVEADRYHDFSDPSATEGVVFVGNYNYAPNREALEYIVARLAPSLPNVPFLLVGAHPPPLPPGRPNVSAPGHVPDLNQALRHAAVCVAPLFKGSGTRLKILTYLASGKAVVATRKAVEGLDVTDGLDIVLRDDEAGFRDALSSLLANPERRRSLGQNGRRLVQERYDWRAHVAPLRELSARLCEPRSR